MNDPTEIEWDLLSRYLGGECTPEEAVRVDHWLAADPRNRERVDSVKARARQALHAMGMQAPSAPRVLSLGRLTPSVPVWRRHARAIAACLVLTGGAIGVGCLLASGRWNATVRGTTMRTLSTTRGEWATHRFIDGTRIVIGPASTLRYPTTFGRDSREVVIEGEAYFDVVHDAGRPFRVRARDAVAEDIGTTFVVRAYPDDPRTQVIVASGRVAIHDTANVHANRELEPGQLGEVSATGELTVRAVRASAYTAWTQGRVVFDDVPVSEVLADVSRWFDLDVSTPDPSLAARHVVLAFTQERADAVLRGLATMVSAHLVQHGRVIQLIGNQSVPSAKTP